MPRLPDPRAGSAALSQAGAAGQLGTPVSCADRALLQLKPLRPFARGEVCAVEASELQARGLR